jgi:hypothetical protein
MPTFTPPDKTVGESTLIKMKKINFFSEQFFTINKEIFPLLSGNTIFTIPLMNNLSEGKFSL